MTDTTTMQIVDQAVKRAYEDGKHGALSQVEHLIDDGIKEETEGHAKHMNHQRLGVLCDSINCGLCQIEHNASANTLLELKLEIQKLHSKT